MTAHPRITWARIAAWTLTGVLVLVFAMICAVLIAAFALIAAIGMVINVAEMIGEVLIALAGWVVRAIGRDRS